MKARVPGVICTAGTLPAPDTIAACPRTTPPSPKRNTSRRSSGSTRPACRSAARTSRGRCSSRRPPSTRCCAASRRDGYITRGGDKLIAFTDIGREHAEGIVRRHRLIERFLTDVLDIPWDEVHEEAERLEHAMSPVLEARMLAAIGDAKTCPHGHPIEVGQRHEGVPLADVEVGATVTDPALRERGRGPPALPEGGRAPSRAWTGTLAERTEDEVVVDGDGGERVVAHRRASRRRSPSPPTRHRRRAPRSRSSW